MEVTTLAGCVIIQSGKILLLHRLPKRWYELPGGKVELGETHQQTITRELMEELSIKVKVGKALGSKAFEQDGRKFFYYWYRANIVSENPILIAENERAVHDHYLWASLNKLAELPLSPNMQNLLKSVFYQTNDYQHLGIIS